jgi:DNA-binding NarL/FixJ family response regulator
MAIRILLADDHQMMRVGLKVLLEKDERFQIVGEANDGFEAIRLAEELRPDIVIMDLEMPRLNGVQATRRLRNGEQEGPKVIVLSMRNEESDVISLIQAGASAFVFKRAAFEELTEAITTVHAGGEYLSAAIRNVPLSEFHRRRSPETVKLTAKEREVLRLLVDGKPIGEVANVLLVSRLTIERHVDKIITKMNAPNLASLLDRIRGSKRLSTSLDATE